MDSIRTHVESTPGFVNPTAQTTSENFKEVFNTDLTPVPQDYLPSEFTRPDSQSEILEELKHINVTLGRIIDHLQEIKNNKV